MINTMIFDLNPFIQKVLSEPDLRDKLEYKFRKTVGRNDLSDQFQESNHSLKNNFIRFSSVFNCSPEDLASDSVRAPINDNDNNKSIKSDAAWCSSVGRTHRCSTDGIRLLLALAVEPSNLFYVRVESWFMCFCFDALMSKKLFIRALLTYTCI